MKQALVCMLLALAATDATAATYRLDPSHSFVTAEVDHFATSTLRVRFGPVAGEVAFDREARRGRIGLRIATASASSGFAPFDAQLRGPDFLASGEHEHPEAFFVADEFVFDGNTLVAVRGAFTLRAVTRPLVLRAERFGCYTSPVFRREVCGGDFSAEILRSEFDITHSLQWVADRVRLRVQVEAVRQ